MTSRVRELRMGDNLTSGVIGDVIMGLESAC